jgi:hypothetical protein
MAKILVGKPERKRPLGRPRHRWVDNIKIDLREIGWGGMNWIDLAAVEMIGATEGRNRDHAISARRKGYSHKGQMLERRQ